MKSSIVPAQITSVEDKIAGNFSLTQIMLLLSCVFLCVLIYSVFPPKNELVGYKVPLIIIVCLLFALCSLRIRGKLLLEWFTVLISFLLRPRIYVFNKNSSEYRYVPSIADFNALTVNEPAQIENSAAHYEFDKKDIDYLMNDSEVSIRFTFGKGGLRVKASKFTT